MGWHPSRLGRPWAVLVAVLLLAAGAYMPARVYLSNLSKFPHPERLALIVLVYWIVSYVFYVVLFSLTDQRWAALAAATSFAVLVGSGGSLSARITSFGGVLTILALTTLIGMLLSRFDQQLQRFVALLALALVYIGPITAYLQAEDYDDGEIGVERVDATVPDDLDLTSDIYVVLFDGFPGEEALQHVYEHEIEWPDIAGVERLEAWANYPVTLGSVAALFEMGIPLQHGAVLDGGTRDALARVMAGDNRFTRILESEGYRTIYVESGWSRSYCHDSIDLCVSSAFLDEGTFEVLRQSVIGPYISRSYGSGLTASSLSTITWLETHLPALAENDRLDFVFASVVLPHPPLMLDENCEVRYDPRLSGNSMYVWDGAIEGRRQAFMTQTECVARVESDLLRAIPPGPLVVALSDHGGDSNGQLSVIGHEWSRQDIIERMNTHLAIRSSWDCDMREPVFLAEVLWRLLWCLSNDPGEAPEPLPGEMDRTFLAERIAEPKVLRLVELVESQSPDLGLATRSP